MNKQKTNKEFTALENIFRIYGAYKENGYIRWGKKTITKEKTLFALIIKSIKDSALNITEQEIYTLPIRYKMFTDANNILTNKLNQLQKDGKITQDDIRLIIWKFQSELMSVIMN